MKENHGLNNVFATLKKARVGADSYSGLTRPLYVTPPPPSPVKSQVKIITLGKIPREDVREIREMSPTPLTYHPKGCQPPLNCHTPTLPPPAVHGDGGSKVEIWSEN